MDLFFFFLAKKPALISVTLRTLQVQLQKSTSVYFTWGNLNILAKNEKLLNKIFRNKNPNPMNTLTPILKRYVENILLLKEETGAEIAYNIC